MWIIKVLIVNNFQNCELSRSQIFSAQSSHAHNYTSGHLFYLTVGFVLCL